MQPDVRRQASFFASKNISSDSLITSEIYDVGILPFNSFFSHITLFNFYDLDNPHISNLADLLNTLDTTDYIILPSQRILKNRISNPDQFPIGNTFYSNLINEKNGFEKIYQTPCDIFCKITYMGDPIHNIEETAVVFDRPTVFIFKKI